jgi:hypothetical protein
MEDVTHASDLTSALTSVRALTDRLKETTDALSRWQVKMRLELNPKTLELRVKCEKGNGQGFIKTLTCAEVLYYQHDIDTFTLFVADLIYENLLKQYIRSTVQQDLTMAVKNVVTMANRS